MGYNLYTTEKVFANEKNNIICNQVMQALINKFPEGVLNTKFGVTGTVAKIIQGDPLEAVKCISFVTDDPDVFTLFKSWVLNAVNHTGSIQYNDKIEIITTTLFIECWFRDSAFTKVDTNGIIGEDKTEIPAYIL